MLSVLVGLTGVGKTSVLERAQEHENCPELTTVNYGDVILELAQEKGLAENRDEITEIPPEPYDNLQEEVPYRIADMSEGEILVLDTHSTLDTPTGYRPGLPQETIEVLDPDNITFVYANAESIQHRRMNDESRERDVPPVSKIREQQDVAKSMASTGAVLSMATLQLIENADGGIDIAAEKYANTLKNLQP